MSLISLLSSEFFDISKVLSLIASFTNSHHCIYMPLLMLTRLVILRTIPQPVSMLSSLVLILLVRALRNNAPLFASLPRPIEPLFLQRLRSFGLWIFSLSSNYHSHLHQQFTVIILMQLIFIQIWYSTQVWNTLPLTSISFVIKSLKIFFKFPIFIRMINCFTPSQKPFRESSFTGIVPSLY